MRLEDWQKLEVGPIGKHFLDSGAFSLWTISANYATEHGVDRWAYYDTPDFYAYMDAYASFVKRYHIAIDHYCNLDVIPNAELSWRNQQYLEQKHDLRPVPVVHFTTDLKWISHYITRGYELLGIGGLAGGINREAGKKWLDGVFELVCDTPDRRPKVKLHGFGITSFRMLTRYPWYSADSTTWTIVGGMGSIIVPHKRQGKFVYTEKPYIIAASKQSPRMNSRGRHLLTLQAPERKIVEEWLNLIGIPMGKLGKDGEVLEPGVLSNDKLRRVANMLFFEQLRKSLPEWPWPWHLKRRGFL